MTAAPLGASDCRSTPHRTVSSPPRSTRRHAFQWRQSCSRATSYASSDLCTAYGCHLPPMLLSCRRHFPDTWLDFTSYSPTNSTSAHRSGRRDFSYRSSLTGLSVVGGGNVIAAGARPPRYRHLKHDRHCLRPDTRRSASRGRDRRSRTCASRSGVRRGVRRKGVTETVSDLTPSAVDTISGHACFGI